MAYLWGDLYKPVKDFFSKEYNTVPLRLEVTPNPKENDWVAPTVERTNNGDFNLTGELGHKFELAAGYPSQGKLTVNGNGRVKVEGKTKHSAELVGVELNALADIGPLDNSSDKYEVTLDLRRYQGAGSIIGRFPHNKAAELEASFCSVFKKQWLIGAQGIFSTSFALSSLIVGASHRAPGRVLAATLDKNKNAKVGILLAAANSPINSEYGAELSVGKATNLTVGMKATVLEGAEKVEYRGKVNNAGAFAISFKRRLTGNVIGTFSADIDLKNSKGTYGLKLVWA